LTAALQFDILSGFSFDSDRDYTTDNSAFDGTITDHFTADSVVATRLGVEYLIPAGEGIVPLWGGVSFTPSNNPVAASNDDPAFMFPEVTLVVSNATVIALGAGYKTEVFDVGIALQSKTGTTNVDYGFGGAIETTVTETSVLASGSFKI